MLTLSPPSRPEHRYPLVEAKRAVRGGEFASASADRSTGWIQMSEAAVIPLTAELTDGDAELAAFHKAEAATHAYHYVSFTCSFGPAEIAPFERAWLEVKLSSTDLGDAPTAWSLAPKDAWEKIESSSTANIGAKFQLVSAEVETGRTAEGKSYFLRAYRERSGNPYWEFRATDTTEIDGTYRFHMITRMLAGLSGRGALSLSATILKRKFLILTKKEAAEAPPEIVFDLPA